MDSVLDALRSVGANKVRSLLTMLSIGIGVFGVIVLMAVAAGAAQGTQEQASGLGSPRLISLYSMYSAGAPTGYYDSPPLGGAPGGPAGDLGGGEGPDAFDLFDPQAVPLTAPAPSPLTSQDVARLSGPGGPPDVVAAAGHVSGPGPTTTTDGRVAEYDQGVTGTGPQYAVVNGLTLRAGTFLTEADVRERSRVAVLGGVIADDLGVGLGDQVLVAGVPFDVIGVVEGEMFDFESGAMSTFVPETTLQDAVTGPREGYDSATALARSDDSVETAAQQIRESVRDSHDLGPTDALDVEVYTRTEELASLRRISWILQALAGAIASVSLFVGGIGVMNIMLVTVTERTREIGIRKAVGAQRHHLLGQFLLEAITLTVLGGLGGMVLGSLVQYVHVQGFSPVVTPFSVAVALGFSVATGLFFGLYPANRAASLPPIQALRYE